MTSSPNRLALFDCDGTLVDSQANICRAMEECFATSRLDPPPREAIRRIVGLSLVPAIAQLLPDAEARQHEAMAEDYKRAFFAMRASGALDPEPLFEGIVDAIETLVETYLAIRNDRSERFLDVYRRVGPAPFKEALYGAEAKAA